MDLESRQRVLTGLHILVMEDDRDAREILRMLLGYFGASFTSVTTATEALRIMKHLGPQHDHRR